MLALVGPSPSDTLSVGVVVLAPGCAGPLDTLPFSFVGGALAPDGSGPLDAPLCCAGMFPHLRPGLTSKTQGGIDSLLPKLVWSIRESHEEVCSGGMLALVSPSPSDMLVVGDGVLAPVVGPLDTLSFRTGGTLALVSLSPSDMLFVGGSMLEAGGT